VTCIGDVTGVTQKVDHDQAVSGVMPKRAIGDAGHIPKLRIKLPYIKLAEW
jgi:hypothetical protein